MIATKLEETRRRLLDLTRRNRLLNHKTTAAGTLHVVDEVPEEVYRVLVTDGQRMQFLAREEAPQDAAAHLLVEAAEEGAVDVVVEGESDAVTFSLPPMEVEAGRAERHTDRRLQTALDGQKLQTRLLYLAREALSALEEQGANVLYLTLGMIEWREGGSDSIASRAPLIFVPVDLKRRSVNSRHTIARFDDDIVTNPCLVELCKRQFHLDLPAFDADEQPDIAAYIARVEAAIAGLNGWRLLPELHVGLFSFAKYLMYRDLNPETWPEGASLLDHPFVRLLSGIDPGGAFPHVEIPDPRTLDDTVTPNECYQVLDADSSQQAAILAAKRGASAVIEGPPGTGKSQTIANIIAECLSEGKTVLFVAEKAAALEVVKRRLENVALGDFVLELHSRKASKRAVLDELRRSIESDRSAPRVAEVDARDLELSRSRLNAYTRELHEPFTPLGISLYEAISKAVSLSDAPEAWCVLADVLAWPAETLSEARDAVDTLDRRLARVGDPVAHPWRGVGLTATGLEVRQAVRDRGARLDQALRLSVGACDKLARTLSTPAPCTPAEAAKLLSDAQTLVFAPPMSADVVADSRWNAISPALARWLEQGAERATLRERWSRVVRAEAEAIDWRELLERRRRQKDSILRFVTPSWYSDGKRLRREFLPGANPTVDEQVGILETLVASAALRASIEAGLPQFSGLFGSDLQGIDGDWARLRRFAESIVAIRQLIIRQAVSTESAQRAVDATTSAELRETSEGAASALDDLDRATTDWLTTISSTDTEWFGRARIETDFRDAAAQLTRALEALESLQDWTDLQATLAETRGHPVEPFVNWALGPEGVKARGRLVHVFLRLFYRLWVDKALERKPALRGFRGEDHEVLIARFKELDERWLEMSKNRLADLVRSKRPDMGRATNRQSKLGIVQAEIRKQRNIMPLRKLLSVAGDVVQAIKPCFMMSPISVAQYLAPGSANFDLVIFDEASQVEPADAYGAIARGRQLLLVGDERQLPPTSFFAKIEGDDPTAASEGDFSASDLESILAVGAVQLPNRCRLRWHYRSKHASLIEFSNEKFYDDAPLRVFPSPHTGREELGLAFRLVEDGVYRRSAGQDNPIEATAVATEVMKHATERPDLSLGVGAFSVAQQRAIQDEIERLRRGASDERVERFFSGHPEEPFFVKNLETIQGDERDVILLSVGYGPDADRRITLNFGPLNREGGWRRLNVLVTRAKMRCVLFSSFRADQLDVSGTRAKGVVALKDYLYYAEHGRLPSIGVPTGEHDSPFEADVCRALREHGWEVHPQVGSAGFSIDLAVVDARAPGRYLLGVECDGATYHSSATARDRDRLREAVLTNLGWKIHRVWSTDWFQRREQVLSKLLARLEDLRDGAESVESPLAVRGAEATRDVPSVDREHRVLNEPPPSKGSEPPAGVVPYAREMGRFLGVLDTLAQMNATEVGRVIADIVRVESPIHRDEALRVLASLFLTRASKRTQEAFISGLWAAARSGAVIERGEFLWASDTESVRVRYRGEGCPVTKPEFIAPEELQAAVKLVLASEFGLAREALLGSTARLLGFNRTGANLSAAIDVAVEALMRSGAITTDRHGFIVLGTTE
jgi:very-short-patch-repair endonuclease